MVGIALASPPKLPPFSFLSSNLGHPPTSWEEPVGGENSASPERGTVGREGSGYCPSFRLGGPDAGNNFYGDKNWEKEKHLAKRGLK